eukprot:SM000120S25712  [mRNA]  locus=s120:206662:212553:- [translate_table: standard]
MPPSVACPWCQSSAGRVSQVAGALIHAPTLRAAEEASAAVPALRAAAVGVVLGLPSSEPLHRDVMVAGEWRIRKLLFKKLPKEEKKNISKKDNISSLH